MRKLYLVAFMVLLIGCWSVAMAGTVNIGNGATKSNPLGTSGAGDPNLVGNGSELSIEIQGSASVTNNVLLTFLIPNDTTDLFGSANPLGTISVYSSFPGTSTTGSSSFTGANSTFADLGNGSGTYKGNGFWGDYSTGTHFFKSFLDSNFNNSNNAPNLTGFDASLGVTALNNVTDYGVYTFDITTGALSGHGNDGLVNISIPGGLPEGSIALALTDTGHSTVWTNDAGINSPLTPTPEPGSVVLFGLGLLATGFWLKHRPDGKRAS